MRLINYAILLRGSQFITQVPVSVPVSPRPSHSLSSPWAFHTYSASHNTCPASLSPSVRLLSPSHAHLQAHSSTCEWFAGTTPFLEPKTSLSRSCINLWESRRYPWAEWMASRTFLYLQIAKVVRRVRTQVLSVCNVCGCLRLLSADATTSMEK